MIKSNKHWILYSLLLIVGLTIGVFFITKQVNEADEDEVKQTAESTVGTTSVPTLRNFDDLTPPSSLRQKSQADNVDSLDILDNDATKRSVYRDLCGSKSLDLKKTLGVSPDNLQFTMEQLASVEAIAKKCQEWLDGVNSGRWSDSAYEASEGELELYRMMSLGSSSTENITIARELLTSKDYRLALESAQVLLAYDEGFQMHVASSTGSQTRSYAANAAGEIFPLLSCKLEGSCGPLSISMLAICLGDEKACGRSMLGYLGTYHSFMYLEDVNAMSEEIYKMITGKG